MAATRSAELLDLELLGLRALVLVGDVVVAFAGLAGELDARRRKIQSARAQRSAGKVRGV
jgi:hypothetical protein